MHSVYFLFLFFLSFLSLIFLMRSYLCFSYMTKLLFDVDVAVVQDIEETYQAKLALLENDKGDQLEFIDPKLILFPNYFVVLFKFWIFDFKKFGTVETILAKAKAKKNSK